MTKLFLSIILLAHITNYTMEVPQQSLWYLLPSDVITIIVAYAAPQDKQSLMAVNKLLSFLSSKKNINPIFQQLIFVLSRQDHIYYMVQAARQKNSNLMICLVRNAHRSDHEDALDLLPLFMKGTNKQICKQCFPYHRQSKANITTEWALLKTLVKGNKKHIHEIYGKKIKEMLHDYRNPDDATLQKLLPFIMALYKGNKKITSQFICKMCPFYSMQNITEENITPLHLASYKNNLFMAELLLIQNPGLINTSDTQGYSPLLYTSNIEMYSLLLKQKNIDINICKKKGITPFYIAVANNKPKFLTLLLTHNPPPNINLTDEKNCTPLFIACQNNNLTITELLLAYGADPNIKNKDNKKPIQVTKNKKIRELLTKK
jgi:ankyrin repeat protein